MLSGIFHKLAILSMVAGPFISGSVYLWKAFWAMSYLVGMGWAIVWTLPMPLGIATFPFWAKQMYDFSSPDIWFWYSGTFIALGLSYIFLFLEALSER